MTRRIEEVAKRAEVAKAARIAMPRVPKRQLAASLGISIGQLNHYLSGRMKAYAVPAWSRRFYTAAFSLAYGDTVGAAHEFRRLADELQGIGPSMP
jgi:hypothetical protein